MGPTLPPATDSRTPEIPCVHRGSAIFFKLFSDPLSGAGPSAGFGGLDKLDQRVGQQVPTLRRSRQARPAGGPAGADPSVVSTGSTSRCLPVSTAGRGVRGAPDNRLSRSRRASMLAFMLSDLWPTYALRIHTPRLTLRLPDPEELAALAQVAADGVHKPDERPFLTPWTEGTPEDRVRTVLQGHWDDLASWTPTNWSLGLGVFVVRRRADRHGAPGSPRLSGCPRGHDELLARTASSPSGIGDRGAGGPADSGL